VNLIFGKKLYSNRLTTELFRLPVMVPPIDYKKVKKQPLKVDIEIARGDMSSNLKDRRRAKV